MFVSCLCSVLFSIVVVTLLFVVNSSLWLREQFGVPAPIAEHSGVPRSRFESDEAERLALNDIDDPDDILDPAFIAIVLDHAGTDINAFGFFERALTRDVHVVTVAPDLKSVALFPGDLRLARPDHSFASFKRVYRNRLPNCVVVPHMRDSNNTAVASWLREMAADDSVMFLALGQGHRTLLASGVAEGAQMASDFVTSWLDTPDKRVTWVRNKRVHKHGNVWTSGAGSAVFDALTTATIHLRGRRFAEALAETQLGFEPAALQRPAPTSAMSIWEVAFLFVRNAFSFRSLTAVKIYPGIDEVALAAVITTWHAAGLAVTTFTHDTCPIKSGFGLPLVAAHCRAAPHRNVIGATRALVPMLDHEWLLAKGEETKWSDVSPRYVHAALPYGVWDAAVLALSWFEPPVVVQFAQKIVEAPSATQRVALARDELPWLTIAKPPAGICCFVFVLTWLLQLLCRHRRRAEPPAKEKAH